MNIASWIILAIVVVWIGFAVKSAFFGRSKKRSCRSSCDDDDKYKLPSVCAGCSKESCAGCTSARLDAPTTIIRELEAPSKDEHRRA